MIRALPGSGLSERVARQRGAQLEESGATVNLLDDRGKPSWSFDPLPFVITPDEWSVLEAGLIQRAGLLDALLGDLYGPQTLLAERLLPPMPVYQPSFLRACRVPTASRLVRSAQPVCRRPGAPSAMSPAARAVDHTGYRLVWATTALEIPPRRRASLPGLPLDPGAPPPPVRRSLAHHAWSKASRHPTSERPNMAVLTPGSLSATYFEHVYLSRALGVPLVEGGDLVARDGEVLIQTFGRPAPGAHARMRRLDSAFADPLEPACRPPALGVTGLVEATRTGKIFARQRAGSLAWSRRRR